MANPVCPGCGHGFFAASSVEALGLEQRVTLVHCARCGVAMGVLDLETPANRYNNLVERLEDIEFKISNFIK